MRVRPRGRDAIVALCPLCQSHGEMRPPHLILRRSDRLSSVPLLKCHRGCDSRDVLAALDLEWRDLYDAENVPMLPSAGRSATNLVLDAHRRHGIRRDFDALPLDGAVNLFRIDLLEARRQVDGQITCDGRVVRYYEAPASVRFIQRFCACTQRPATEIRTRLHAAQVVGAVGAGSTRTGSDEATRSCCSSLRANPRGRARKAKAPPRKPTSHLNSLLASRVALDVALSLATPESLVERGDAPPRGSPPNPGFRDPIGGAHGPPDAAAGSNDDDEIGWAGGRLFEDDVWGLVETPEQPPRRALGYELEVLIQARGRVPLNPGGELLQLSAVGSSP